MKSLFENIVDSFASAISSSKYFLTPVNNSERFYELKLVEKYYKANLSEARVRPTSWGNHFVLFVNKTKSFPKQTIQCDLVNIATEDVFVIILDNIINEDINYGFRQIRTIVADFLGEFEHCKNMSTLKHKYISSAPEVIAIKILQAVGADMRKLENVDQDYFKFILENSLKDLYTEGKILEYKK